MYGIILATALTTGSTAPDHFYRRCHGCAACYSCSCACSCYGCGCYGCGGCYSGGGYGGYGGGGCGSYYGCWSSCGCYGCYGSCGGWGWGCSCSCSCYGCHGCYGGHGCYSYHAPACYGCTVPHAAPAPAETMPAPGKTQPKKEEVYLNNAAMVVVKADPSVTIKVNGVVTPRSGAVESYRSPSLTPGHNYSYTVVAELTRDGKALSETKEITVAAGRETVVDFTNLGTPVAAVESSPANVTVILPEGAKLTVNDVVVNVSGNQTFQTPSLEKGKNYFYTVKAELNRDGQTVAETRRIDVTAGKAVTVDFTKASTLTASR